MEYLSSVSNSTIILSGMKNTNIYDQIIQSLKRQSCCLSLLLYELEQVNFSQMKNIKPLTNIRHRLRNWRGTSLTALTCPVIIKFSIRRYSDCLCLKLSLVEGWGETRQTHQKYYACSVNFSGSAISDLNQDTWFSHLFPTTKCSSIASQSILKVLRKGRSSVMIK